MKNHVMTFIKGMLVGATLRVPGVSGGAVAVILGVYNKLLYCLNNVFREFKKCFWFLFVFAAGAGVAFLALNEVLYRVFGRFPAITAYCFIGMLIASFPIVWKESGIKWGKSGDFGGESGEKGGKNGAKNGENGAWQGAGGRGFGARREGVLGARRVGSWKVVGYLGLFLVGAAFVAGLGFLQGGLNVDNLRGVGYYAFIAVVGMVCGFVFIIPGISFATMLLVFGIDPLFTASLRNFDFAFLLPFGVGGLIGFVLCAKVMYVLFKKFSKPTYMVIMGFLLGTIALLFALPEYRPLDVIEGAWCALSFVIGAGVVLGVFFVAAWLERRRNHKSDCKLIKDTL